MYHARDLVVSAKSSTDEWEAEANALGEVKPQWMENWYDGLGFCECDSERANHSFLTFSRYLEWTGTEVDQREGVKSNGRSGGEQDQDCQFDH